MKRSRTVHALGQSEGEDPCVSASPTFSESEKTDIAEALSSVLGFDLKVRAAIEESLDAPALLIIALGTIGTAFLAGFLAKMGSDAWDYAKKKIVDAAARHGNDNGTRIRVRFQHNGAKVICSLRTVDSQIMQKALDELKMVFGEVRDMAAKDQLPGTEAYIYYKFRDMKWRIDEATVMQPEFDVLKFDYITGSWVPSDPKASKLLREFQRKMKAKQNA